MSDTNLNIAITSSDAGAKAEIRALQSTVKELSSALAQLTAVAANASGIAAASIQKEIASRKANIAAIEQEIALKKASSSAGIGAAQQEAAYINRNMDLVAQRAQQQIRMRNAIARAEQQAAMDSARYEAESINAGMAAREAATRRAISLQNQRVYQERAQAEANMRAEAEYINRNSDLAYAAMRREADLMNQNFNLRQRRTSQEGEGGFMANLGRPQMIRHGVAEIDSLMRGQRGQAMASIGAAMRDAGLGAAALTTSMVGLVALMGSSTILRGAEAMGHWAAESRAAASASGMSLSAYSQLQGALVLTGMKANEADSALRRVAVNLSTAIANPASQAAEAFHNLGISQEQLVATGGNVDALLKLLADAFVRTADGANKSAAMSAIAGRGFESLIPALQNGSAGLSGFEAEAKRLGITLDEETAKKLEEAGQAVEHLGKTITGSGVQAFAAWSPVIVATAGALETLWEVMAKIIGGIGTVTSFIERVSSYVPQKAFDLGVWASGGTDPTSSDAADARRGRMAGGAGKAQVPPMTKSSGAETTIESIHNQMALAAASVSGGGNRQTELKAEINTLQQLMATEVLTDKERTTLGTELANKTKQLNNEMAAAGTKAAKQTYEDFVSSEKLKIAEAEGSSTRIKAIYDEWISAAIGKYKQLGSAVDALRAKELNAVNAAKRSEITKQVSTDEKGETLAALNSRLDALTSGRAIPRDQKTGPSADFAQAGQDIGQAQQIAATSQAQIAALKQYGATVEEVIGIEIQAKTKEVALYERAAEASQAAVNKIAAPWLRLADSIGSQFESLTGSLISAVIAPQVTMLKQGLTSIKVSGQGDEIRSIFRSAFLKIAGDFGSAIEGAIGNVVANIISKGAANTIGELVSQTISKAIGGIVGSAAGSAIGGVAGNVAGQAAGSVAGQAAGGAIGGVETVAAITGLGVDLSGTIATFSGLIVGAITTASAAITGAISAGDAVLDLELAALNAKPSFLGFTYAQGGIVPSAAGGMVVGGNGGSLAVLHAREMVLPAPISEGIQRMIARGGSGTGGNMSNSLNYAPTINNGPRGRSGTGMTRSELSQVLAQHSGAMLGEARNMMRSGWRPA